MNADALSADEIALWLRLMATEGVGDVTAQRLLQAFGLPEHIFVQSYTALIKVVSERVARALLSEPEDLQRQTDITVEWCAQPDNHLITLAHSHYPQTLLTTTDPPILLYAKGRLDLLNNTPSLAMVGSRNASAQGIQNTEWFARELAQGGFHIISGLALGIDAAAHRGALTAYRAAPDNAGSTIAVIGTGCDIIYPARNRDLTYAIAQDGLILSEFPLGAKAQPTHFPRRNRIISGLAQGVLVVEAALQSGSLITARQALEQNREVFAIPGSIHSPLSKGCHALIKQGAKLVESAQDILDELQGIGGFSTNINPRDSLPEPVVDQSADDAAPIVAAIPVPADDPPPSTTASAQTVLNALGHDPCDLDTLALRTTMTVGELLTELMTLELNGQVEKRAGNIYVRLSAN